MKIIINILQWELDKSKSKDRKKKEFEPSKNSSWSPTLLHQKTTGKSELCKNSFSFGFIPVPIVILLTHSGSRDRGEL